MIWCTISWKNNGCFCLFCTCFFWDHFPNKNEDLPWQRVEMRFFVALRGSTLLWVWSRPQVSGGSTLPGFLFRDHAHTIHGTGIFTPNLQKWATCRSICHTWMIWDISYIDIPWIYPPSTKQSWQMSRSSAWWWRLNPGWVDPNYIEA